MGPRLRRVLAPWAALGLVLAACSSGSPGQGSGPTPCGPGQSPPNPCPAPAAPAPTVASLSPATAVAGSGAFTLTVNGSSFTSSSVVQWNSAALPTTFVGATQLSAAVPAADVSAEGTVQVAVSTPAPGGGMSGAVPFTVTAAHQGQTVGVVAVVSVNAKGEVGDRSSFNPSMSADGRYVVFSSLATNLVDGDTNDAPDVFWHDTCRGPSAPPGCSISTQRVSVDFSGHQLAGGATVNTTIAPATTISGDGRFVLFLAQAGELLANPGVADFTVELFVRDTCTGQPASCAPSTALVSQDALGHPANASVDTPSISRDGWVVTFQSGATNLVTDPVMYGQVFVRETCFGVSSGCTPANHLVSVSTGGDPGNAGYRSATISAGGRYVVFQTRSSNLLPNDTNQSDDIFERDTCIGAPPGCTPSTTLVSVPRSGSTPDLNVYAGYASVSEDGRFVVFQSNASDLVAQDTHGSPQVFLRDTCAGASGPCTPQTSLLSAALDGTAANSDSNVNGATQLSGTGRYAAFASEADNLLPGIGPLTCYVKDTCAGASAGCAPRLEAVSVDAQGTPLRSCGNGLGGDGLPVLSTDGHLGLLERFDQASNALQAYLVLTGF